jgi:hypothetical protein
MGIAYFDQVRVLLYLTLAIGAAAGAFVPVPEASPEDVEVLDEKEGYPEGLSSAMPARHS